jgi:hypothetical protein
MLHAGRWQIDGYADTRAGNRARRVTGRVHPGQPLVLRLAQAGGYAARVSPAGQIGAIR